MDIEYRISRDDTGPRWLNSKGRIYRDAAGTARRFIGTNLDITERRRAEEELRLKEKLLDGASDSIFLHDLAGQFLYLNEAAYKSRGYEKEELMSLNVPALPTPEFLQDRAKRLQELQAQGEMIFEAAHRRKDGSVMPVEIHARLLDLDDRRLILSVTRDITERKQAEEALRTAAQQWRTTFDAISDAVCLLDRGGRIIQSNRAMAELAGKPQAEITGHFSWEFMDETGPVKLGSRLQQVAGHPAPNLDPAQGPPLAARHGRPDPG